MQNIFCSILFYKGGAYMVAPIPVELKEFLRLVNAQCVVLNEFISLTNRKKELVVANDTDALKELLKEESSLVSKHTEIEEKRKKTAGLLAAAIGVRARQLKFTVLLERYKDHEIYDVIDKTNTKLTNTLAELKEVNDATSDLIKRALEHIDFSINTFKSSSGAMYITGDGQEISTGKSLFDAKQ